MALTLRYYPILPRWFPVSHCETNAYPISYLFSVFPYNDRWHGYLGCMRSESHVQPQAAVCEPSSSDSSCNAPCPVKGPMPGEGPMTSSSKRHSVSTSNPM